MYGNVHRKIITNSPEAWNLAGVAKRLSFAIDNMNLPIANLVVDTPGGGNVNVFRHGSMEIWNLKSGGRKYFQFKILRDDGTYIGEDKIESIEIFLDTGERNKIGEVYCPPVMYVWNLDLGGTPETDPEVIKMRDTMYNLKADGTRGDIPKKRYDPKTKIWTFDGYQRPWSWWYGTTETDDLTKPTSPPYMEGNEHIPSNKYNPITGEYERKKTSGYLVRVRCKEDGVDSYYRKPKKTDPDGQLARGYKYDSVLFHWDQTDASLIYPKYYFFHLPYWKVTPSVPGYISATSTTLTAAFVDGVSQNGYYVFLSGGTYTKKINVKSSIPYKITWRTSDRNPRVASAYQRITTCGVTFQFGTCWDGEQVRPLAHIGCSLLGTPVQSAAIAGASGLGLSFSLSADTISLTINDNEIPVQESVKEFPKDESLPTNEELSKFPIDAALPVEIVGKDYIATFAGGGAAPEELTCDSGWLAVGCVPAENVGGIPGSYTQWYPGVYDCVAITGSYNY